MRTPSMQVSARDCHLTDILRQGAILAQLVPGLDHEPEVQSYVV